MYFIVIWNKIFKIIIPSSNVYNRQYIHLFTDLVVTGHSTYPSENRSEKQQQSDIPALPSDGYNNNEVLFKAATIAVPICGAVILFILIALAIRILKNDGIDTPSKLSTAGSRKSTLDFEAYGAAQTQNIKHLPLLKQPHSAGANEFFNNQNICHNDLKNECLAKKNQLMTLEYTLLAQSCNDPNNKPTNTEIGGTTSLYRNVNLSSNETGRSKDVCDNKVYEKEILNPAPYWAGAASNNN